MLNEDYREVLHALSEEKVKFLIVGAYAMAAHGYVRATMDLDIWVGLSRENAEAILCALSRLGADIEDLNDGDLMVPDTVFRIGMPPRQIDIITSLSGVGFPKAYNSSIKVEVDGVEIRVLSIPDLIRNKRATGRRRDVIDAEELERFL